MRNALFIIGALALVGATVAGLLGFFAYPTKNRRRKRRDDPQEGFARALCIILAAGAFVALFFGWLLPA